MIAPAQIADVQTAEARDEPGRGQRSPAGHASDALHAKHQTLMRAYQARYVVLPSDGRQGSVLAWLKRRYDPTQLAWLEARRPALELELIAPLAETARVAAAGADVASYAAALLPQVHDAPENPFITYLRTNPNREHHYRDFLLQSSADLLAEASASALGVVGSFGPPQSALFRILIDEFGYGAHGRKHSVLYQAVMRDFGLADGYDAYGPLFDTAALELHNTIHYLFQNPRNIFLQIGFLLFAETAYQRSTADHFRYLREFHPGVDARYFGEHAHIDLHHTRMIIEDVAAPMVATYGQEVGAEIVAGAALTRTAFDRAGSHLLAVAQAFAAAAAESQAVYARPGVSAEGPGVTPLSADAAPVSSWIQVGGLGRVTPAAFAGFPAAAFGRRLDAEDFA